MAARPRSARVKTHAAPTFGTGVSSLPPEGAFATWGGPALLCSAHLRTTTRPFKYSPSGNSMVIGWSGAAPRRSVM